MNYFIVAFILFVMLNPIHLYPQVPEWAKGIVWYQIFPERFANGDLSNDPEPGKVFINADSIPHGWKIKKWTSNWFSQDEWEKNLGGNFRDHLYERRYGGDIQGVIDRLDYLQELGIGAIYLNPVFEAASLHKYDGSTYHHIDVNFGPDPDGDRKLIDSEISDDPSTWVWTAADKLFLDLINEVHIRGMKIIIDGVFNHTGVQFWAFLDILVNGKKSKYRDWYRIDRFDDVTTAVNEFSYKGWWGVKSLPEFNKNEFNLHPGPKEYIFNSTKRWMDPDNDGDPSDGIDGWRLDVARELPYGFWNEWSKLVKSVNSNSLIVGELWELSPDFVSDNGPFDALMNYNFAFAVNDYIIADKKAITSVEFVNKLNEVDSTYPEENLLCLQNLMDSHDTDRLSSMIKNPDRNFDRDANEGNKNYNPGKPTNADYQKQKLIAALQMMLRGAPMIYYGDEIGMWGADDPHDRKPMVWDDLSYENEVITEAAGFGNGIGSYIVEQNRNLFSFYKKIISIRNNNPVLKTGNQKIIFSPGEYKVFVIERFNNDNKIVAAFNFDSVDVSVNLLHGKNIDSSDDLVTGEQINLIGLKGSDLWYLNLSPNSVTVFEINNREAGND